MPFAVALRPTIPKMTESTTPPMIDSTSEVTAALLNGSSRGAGVWYPDIGVEDGSHWPGDAGGLGYTGPDTVVLSSRMTTVLRRRAK